MDDEAQDVSKALEAFGMPQIRYHSFSQAKARPMAVQPRRVVTRHPEPAPAAPTQPPTPAPAPHPVLEPVSQLASRAALQGPCAAPADPQTPSKPFKRDCTLPALFAFLAQPASRDPV